MNLSERSAKVSHHQIKSRHLSLDLLAGCSFDPLYLRFVELICMAMGLGEDAVRLCTLVVDLLLFALLDRCQCFGG